MTTNVFQDHRTSFDGGGGDKDRDHVMMLSFGPNSFESMMKSDRRSIVTTPFLQFLTSQVAFICYSVSQKAVVSQWVTHYPCSKSPRIFFIQPVQMTIYFWSKILTSMMPEPKFWVLNLHNIILPILLWFCGYLQDANKCRQHRMTFTYGETRRIILLVLLPSF